MLSCVVLFDLDGTLVAGPHGEEGAGVYAMNAASLAITGKPASFLGSDYAGRTDTQIARMLLIDAGVEEPNGKLIDALIESYLLHLEYRIRDFPSRLLGNPRAAIEDLRKKGATVGLGTGNVRKGAYLKLVSAGIGDLFDLNEGGFGEDGHTRAELLRAGALTLNPNSSFPIIVVGDTPRDVEGAHEIGAFCIGVPFKKNDRKALEAAGADAIVDCVDENISCVVKNLINIPKT